MLRPSLHGTEVNIFVMNKFDYSLVLTRADGTTKIIPVEFTRALSSKSIRITPNLARQIVRVSYPIYSPRARAISFLEDKKEWVATKLSKAPDKTRIEDGMEISIFGRIFRIAHLPNARRGVFAEGGTLFVSGGSEFMHRRVLDYIKIEAGKFFTNSTRAYAKKLDKKPAKISIKDTTSRWGSCTADGYLSFSWRLAFAPIHIAQYIAAHEVAHLAEMNHSPKFWRTLARMYDGDIEAAQKWLARNGAKLWTLE